MITQRDLYIKYLREEWYELFPYKEYEARVEKAGTVVTDKHF